MEINVVLPAALIKISLIWQLYISHTADLELKIFIVFVFLSFLSAVAACYRFKFTCNLKITNYQNCPQLCTRPQRILILVGYLLLSAHQNMPRKNAWHHDGIFITRTRIVLQIETEQLIHATHRLFMFVCVFSWRASSCWWRYRVDALRDEQICLLHVLKLCDVYNLYLYQKIYWVQSCCHHCLLTHTAVKRIERAREECFQCCASISGARLKHTECAAIRWHVVSAL